MDLLELHYTHLLHQNSDYSDLFAGSLDWDELVKDQAQLEIHREIDEVDDRITQYELEHVESAEDESLLELKIHREIDEVDDRITQYELKHVESAEDESLLELKLWKAQLRLRLKKLRNAPTGRALLSLQLEEVQLQMRLRKIRCKAANGSAADLEDDRDYVRLNVQRLGLRDELAQIPKAGQIPNPSLEPNQVPQQVRIPEVVRHS